MTTDHPLKIIKPYSKTRTVNLETPGKSFISLIKTTSRPYVLPLSRQVHEEIKVEDEPPGGLDALSRAVELATQPTYFPPSSAGSTLTVYSSPDPSQPRLPTPPSQSPSPPPMYDSVVRGAALGLRGRSVSMAEVPVESPKGRSGKEDENEARRLQGLLSIEEMVDFRKKRRRGAGHVFSAASLRKELDRLDRQY